MMKVYTQTWYRGNNYGSVLQAYALQHTISDMGYACSVLNYKPTKADMWKLKFINHSLKETIQYKINEYLMKKNGASEAVNNLSLFDDFRAQHMQITPPCSTAPEIARICGDDAVFVCGSDQIWNPYLYDPYYFLEFVQDSRRKIAYAPSFGVMEIPHRCQQRLRKAIAPFRYVSVREKRGAEIVRELTGKQVMVAVDPTLLVSMAHWQTLAKPIDSEQKVPVLLFSQRKCAIFGNCRENRTGKASDDSDAADGRCGLQEAGNRQGARRPARMARTCGKCRLCINRFVPLHAVFDSLP